MKTTDFTNKRLLTKKEFQEYTGFGPSTADNFGKRFKVKRKIGNRWRYDKIKTDQILDWMYKVKD